MLNSTAARLTTLIADQERLLKVVRDEKTELVRVDVTTPSSLQMAFPSWSQGGEWPPTLVRLWSDSTPIPPGRIENLSRKDTHKEFPHA
jgi:hypothetical protein